MKKQSVSGEPCGRAGLGEMDVDERQEERHSAGSCQRRHGAGPMEAAAVQQGGVTGARSQVRKWKFRRRDILSLSHFATERWFLEPPLRVKASGLGSHLGVRIMPFAM